MPQVTRRTFLGTAAHLGNNPWRTGCVLKCDPATGRVIDDAEAMKLWEREYAPGWLPMV